MAIVVYAPGLKQATQATDLDIDDAAGTQVERFAGVGY
jgi:hypothetical protein